MMSDYALYALWFCVENFMLLNVPKLRNGGIVRIVTSSNSLVLAQNWGVVLIRIGYPGPGNAAGQNWLLMVGR